MGFRTVVMLSNDTAHEWENDPELGRKIARAMNHAGRSSELAEVDNYGRVVECAHADIRTLAVLDSHSSFTSLAYGNWSHKEKHDEVMINLLKAAANELGFKLIKKSSK